MHAQVDAAKFDSVVFAIMTPTMFVSGFDEDVEGCEWRGRPLGCHFMPVNDSALYQRAGKRGLPARSLR